MDNTEIVLCCNNQSHAYSSELTHYRNSPCMYIVHDILSHPQNWSDKYSISSLLLCKTQDESSNGILLPKLFWPTVRKKCSIDREKLLKFDAEVWEFAKFLRSLEQFIETVKGQYTFW